MLQIQLLHGTRIPDGWTGVFGVESQQWVCFWGAGLRGRSLSVVILLTFALFKKKKLKKFLGLLSSSSLDDTSEIAPFSQAVPDQVQYHETPTFAF